MTTPPPPPPAPENSAPAAAPLAPLRFRCSICGDPSGDICHACTKDSCPNHLCDRCLCCSDCCRCEVSLVNDRHVAGPAHAAPAPVPDLQEPEAEPIGDAPLTPGE